MADRPGLVAKANHAGGTDSGEAAKQPSRNPGRPASQPARGLMDGMIEVETRHEGGLAIDFARLRRRRMMGLVNGTTVAALARTAPGRVERSGIVRGDIRRSFGTARGVARGVRLDIRLRLTSANSGRPLTDHAVYLWHADADGRYSLAEDDLTEGNLAEGDLTEGNLVERDENYLRGIQVTDSAGWVRFTSIRPGARDGWPRLHVEVYPSLAATDCPATRLHTTEITLPGDAGHPGAYLEMACLTGDAERGFVATRMIQV
jgi:protocatechuate 3,4-dioxygenase beta subunit